MDNRLKVLLACTAIVFSFGVATSSLANIASPSAEQYFNGAYLGVGGGIVHALSDVESTYHAYDKDSPNVWYETSTYDFKIGEYGFNANIFAGYGKMFRSPYYFGGEIFANYFSPKMKSSHDYVYFEYSYYHDMNIRTQVENPYSFGGDLRAGYLVLPRTMLYVLFGLDYAKFNVKNEAIDAGGYAVSNMPIANKFDKWQLGYMPGIGIETGLSDHISLRAQYTYTFYSSLSHSASFVDHETWKTWGWVTVVNLKTKVKPQRSKFTVMLSYLFN